MAWRTMRNEISFGVGASNFMSDLGGRDMIGSDFLWDLEISKTAPAFHFSYGYYLAETFVFRCRVSYAQVAGDDKLTEEPYRNNRNLHVKNDIIEASTTFEWYFLKEKGGNRYGLRNKAGLRGKLIGAKAGGLGSYLFAGFGGFYHDPKAFYANQWVKLKPLRTEGQGLPNGPEEYSNFVACIPVGFGLRKGLGSTGQWFLGLEFSYRFTFTDYLDDVSGFYYDKTIIGQEYGPAAQYLADPSLGLNIGTPDIPPNSIGQMRGDITDKDGYMFAMLTVNYKMKKQPKRYSSMRRKRYKASF